MTIDHIKKKNFNFILLKYKNTNEMQPNFYLGLNKSGYY